MLDTIAELEVLRDRLEQAEARMDTMERDEGGGGATAEIVRIQIPSGGIATATSADCRYYTPGGLSGASDTLEVWNRTGALVNSSGAVKIGYAAWIDRESEYQVINEVCA